MTEVKRWTARRIRVYNLDRNCECGNRCYRIVGGEAGNYLVEWTRDRCPMDCPFECEDCAEEAADREVKAYGDDVE